MSLEIMASATGVLVFELIELLSVFKASWTDYIDTLVSILMKSKSEESAVKRDSVEHLDEIGRPSHLQLCDKLQDEVVEINLNKFLGFDFGFFLFSAHIDHKKLFLLCQVESNVRTNRK